MLPVQEQYHWVLDNDNCKHNKTKLKETKKLFEAKWDKINSLFRTDKDFKIKLKNKEFDGMSDSKIDKITTSLDELSKLLKDYIRDNCR